LSPTKTNERSGLRAGRKGGPVPPERRREGGFTLIEVLFAMVIMVVALVSLAELMAITVRMQMLGRNETGAVRLAQSKIDELVNLDFTANTTTNVGGSLTSDVATYNDTPVMSGTTSVVGYKRRWQIQAMTGCTPVITCNKVRKLTVRIIPTTNDRRTNAQIDLTTIIRSP
jgi:prepilin-type N-terminal cleavage/methylation domain-containing protein